MTPHDKQDTDTTALNALAVQLAAISPPLAEFVVTLLRIADLVPLPDVARHVRRLAMQLDWKLHQSTDAATAAKGIADLAAEDITRLQAHVAELERQAENANAQGDMTLTLLIALEERYQQLLPDIEAPEEPAP